MNTLITIATICIVGTLIAQGGSCRSESAKVSNANAKVETPAAPDKIKTGVWGGEHIRAEVTENGADLEFDCANGKISKAIVLDGKGHFDLTGTFATEHAGPVRDESSTSRAVRYSGSVKGDELTLTITDANTKEAIGTFTLVHGNDARLRKCR